MEELFRPADVHNILDFTKEIDFFYSKFTNIFIVAI